MAATARIVRVMSGVCLSETSQTLQTNDCWHDPQTLFWSITSSIISSFIKPNLFVCNNAMIVKIFYFIEFDWTWCMRLLEFILIFKLCFCVSLLLWASLNVSCNFQINLLLSLLNLANVLCWQQDIYFSNFKQHQDKLRHFSKHFFAGKDSELF